MYFKFVRKRTIRKQKLWLVERFRTVGKEGLGKKIQNLLSIYKFKKRPQIQK